jgi:hypothetical protein
VGPPRNRKNSIFLRAVGVGGQRSTIEVERSAPNARVRAMSASAATHVSWIRARGRAGGRSGRASAFAAVSCSACDTIPDLRLSGHEAELAVRRELRPRERGVGRNPLTVSGNVLCSRPTLSRPTTAADRAQCDAHIMPRVCQRIPKRAVCAVLRA